MGSNRTFMELKYIYGNFIEEKDATVLIVPLWN